MQNPTTTTTPLKVLNSFTKEKVSQNNNKKHVIELTHQLCLKIGSIQCSEPKRSDVVHLRADSL